MGRLSKRTIQCRAARKQRDLQQKLDGGFKMSPSSTRSSLLRAVAYGCGTDFHKLCEESLQRYQQAYGLVLMPNSSREELVWAIKHHFQYQEVVDESHILYGFVQALKRDSSSDSSYSTSQ